MLKKSVILLGIVLMLGTTGCTKASGDAPAAVPEETSEKEVMTPVESTGAEGGSGETGASTGESGSGETGASEGAETGIDTGSELMGYFGENISRAKDAFSNIEEMGEYENLTLYMDKEEEYDGVLAGPEFNVDSDLQIVGIAYSGKKYTLAGISTAMTMQDAMGSLKEEGWTLSGVDFAHGTAQYVVSFDKDGLTLSMVSTDEGEFGKTEESDVTGSVERISVVKK